MADTFELETRDGIRRVEFDPDVFFQRNVHVLVDGRRAGSMPYPKGAASYQETTIELGDRVLVAVAFVSGKPWPGNSWGLQYDLFRDGRSLTDQSTLEDVRRHGRAAGKAYPGFFRFIDGVLQIGPGAAAAGMAVAFVRRAEDLGLPAAIVLGAFMLAGLGLGTVVAGRAWQSIRSRTQLSAAHRSVMGCGAVAVCLAGIWGAAVAVAAAIIAGFD